MDEELKIITAAEVAELLGVTRETVYRLTRANQIPHFRIGTAIRYSKKSIIDWIAVELDERNE